MRPLSAGDIVRAWEEGEGQHPIDRALTLLAAGSPEARMDALAALPVGERDARLLELRAMTFGHALVGYDECPVCGERIEFNTTIDALRVPPGAAAGEALELAVGDRLIRYRLPDSVDLASAARCEDPLEGRRRLLERCVIEVRNAGGARERGEAGDAGEAGGERRRGEPDDPRARARLPADLFTEETVALLSAHMAECDPRAEMLFNLACPACGHGWQVLFDIGEFFWAEVTRHARRALSEVHTLARAYGWNEAEILALSARRRQFYLDMVGA